jgi:hypothetical protein
MNTISEALKEEVVSRNDMWNTKEIVGIRDENEEELKCVHVKTLLKYIIVTYIANGKFIPKSKDSPSTPATYSEAMNVMLNSENNTEIHKRVKYHSIARNAVGDMLSNILHWMKRTNLEEFGKETSFQPYFSKLEKIARTEYISPKESHYVAGIFQTYLQFSENKRRKEIPRGEDYVGAIGEIIRFNGTVLSAKTAKYGKVIYIFHDMSGKIIKCVMRNVGFEKGNTYSISGVVKSHEVDIWTKIPTTVIVDAKRETI